MDISKVISDAVDNASYQTSNGMIDLEDPNHLFLVREELEKHLSAEIVDSILCNIYNPNNKKDRKLVEIAMKVEQSKINDIMDYLNSGKIFRADVVNQMHALASRDQMVYDETLTFLQDTVGFPSGPSEVICDKIFADPSEVQNIVGYLNKRTLTLKAGTSTTVTSALSGAGLPSTFVNWLSTYHWAANPSTGRGEAALALLCKGGKKESSGGDVTIDGKEVEVKGKGGRLRGFSGVGNPEAGHKVSMDGLQKLLDKFHKNKKVNTHKDYPFDVPTKAPAGTTDYQISKNSYSNNMIAKYSPTLIKHKIAKKKDFADLYLNSIKGVYTDSKFDLKAPSVDAEGKIKNVATYVDVDWFKAAYKLYAAHVDLIAIIPGDGKLVILDVNSNPTQFLKITSRPGFNKGGGSFGSAFSIDPK